MMKKGKKPTRNQKKLIKSAGLNPDNWFIVKNPSGELHLVHRETGTHRVISVA
jgi:membrane-bound lytic murein transglycosylase MltF